MIEVIGTELNQWDTGRSVRVTGTDASHVHLANQGDSKAVIMELVDSMARIPDYLLQTGKQLCVYAVANGVTIESKVFYVKKRERPENYVYEEDQRNFIYELITDAQEATNAANQAAQDLLEAKDRGDFNGPKGDPFVIINDARGEEIAIDDAAKHTLVGMRIFGKTTQDGVPTPETPVELVNIANGGSITVVVTGKNDAQSVTVATANGLPGIPVASGGNYTDSNGQQWICDEIDLARGVYVKRIVVIDYTDSSTKPPYRVVTGTSEKYRFEIAWDALQAKTPVLAHPLFCTVTAAGSANDTWLCKDCVSHSNTGKIIYLYLEELATSTNAEALAWLREKQVKVLYQLSVPIETPLSAEEIAAYAALHTYRGNTTVSNDAGAWMEIGYVMDAKKYLDSLASSTILAATVE